MRTSSTMMKSWHHRDFLKSHKNKHSARPLCGEEGWALCFFDGLEVDKIKIRRVNGFHPAPHNAWSRSDHALLGGRCSLHDNHICPIL